MPNEEQGSGFSVYLVTDEQLHALKQANSPLISGIIVEIESQAIGALRGYVDAPASEARGILLDRYRQAISQIESEGPAVSNSPEEVEERQEEVEDEGRGPNRGPNRQKPRNF
jgi:hypothetical protein